MSHHQSCARLPLRVDVSGAIYTIGHVHWCCAVKTSEDKGRQLESDPLRNPKPVEFLEQWRHVIKFPGTELQPEQRRTGQKWLSAREKEHVEFGTAYDLKKTK